MQYATLGRAAAFGLALLLMASLWAVSAGAEEPIAIKVTALKGAVNVVKPDGTTESLEDTAKPIALPATIEMVGPKGSFWISLPSAVEGKFNTISWTLQQGETVKVSLLEGGKGIRFEYLKGTRKFCLDVNNRENVLLVRSVTGTTTVVVLQNTVAVPEKGIALLTFPMNSFASVTVLPAQVSELQFSYSPEDRYVEFMKIVSQAGTIQVTRAGVTQAVIAGAPALVRPIAVIPPWDRLFVPRPEPEPVEQSPYRPWARP